MGAACASTRRRGGGSAWIFPSARGSKTPNAAIQAGGNKNNETGLSHSDRRPSPYLTPFPMASLKEPDLLAMTVCRTLGWRRNFVRPYRGGDG